MELDTGGKITASPTAEDIAAAVDGAGPDAHARDWYINLDTEAGAYLESNALPDGSFDLLYVDSQRRMRATGTLQAAQVKSIFTRFLGQDKHWRDGIQWMAEGKVRRAGDTSGPKDGSEPPAWAIATIIGSIAVALGGANLFGGYVPDTYRTYFYVGLVFSRSSQRSR